MTKGRQKTESAIIHATSAVTNDAVDAALWEQLYEMKGGDYIARRLSERLREPSPHPALLAMMARWLDPQNDNDPFKLVVKHRRDKATWTTRVNDAAIARALQQEIAAGMPKYGMNKRVGERLGVSRHKVRQIHNRLTPK
jgi:hypothetical protein